MRICTTSGRSIRLASSPLENRNDKNMMKRILKWIGIGVVLLLVAAYGTYRWKWRGAPATLGACHARLLAEMPKEEVVRIKDMTNMSEMIVYHLGAGMGMRNEWGLWAGSPLYWHLWRKGLRHPDDMSGYILDTLWCRVHEKPYPDLEKKIAYLKAFYRAQADPPASARTPNGDKIDFLESWGGDDSNGMPVSIHIGRCGRDSSFWAYEWNKGVYAATGEMLECILRDDYWKPRMSNNVQQGVR
jgi:hypothetical protein